MSWAVGFPALHLSWLAIIIIVAVLIFVLAVAWVGRAELAKIAKRLPKIGEILWSIWCFLFIIRWKFQFALRNFFIHSTLGVLALASFYLAAELGVALFHRLGVAWQRPRTWYGTILAKELPPLPFWLDA